VSPRLALWIVVVGGAEVLLGSTAFTDVVPPHWANLAQACIGAVAGATATYRALRTGRAQ
jgi:hypothetical protein